MPWQSLRIAVPRALIEEVSDTLIALGAVSITLMDAQDEPLLEPGPNELPLWEEAHVTALFEADASLEAPQKALAALLPGVESEVEHIADQVWERVCLAHVKPMQFGESLWVVPSTWEGEQPSGRIIMLDPGLAFGTGTHPTTRLMLTFLDGYDCAGKTIVDFGCGSGILAVAAAKLGAAHVLAIDHDPQALTATRDNAIKNHCEEVIDLALPNAYDPIQADVVLANIILEPLLMLHDTLKALVKPGGLLVLSGVLANQEALLREGYSDCDILEVTNDEGWLRIIIRSI
ncbi:MAG: 50S ribosomal protein L11 methyltransferase [Gammaproteobacteria bacterium]